MMGRMTYGILRRLAFIAVATASFLALAPVGQARVQANPILFVNFFSDGTIAVTLADGTKVGTNSGSPTVIPGGYYAIVYSGPGGCSALPYFYLRGPGMTIT